MFFQLAIIQTVTQTQLFPKDYIYKEYYEMSDGEITIVKNKLKQEAEEAAYQQNELNQISPGAGELPQGNTPGGMEATPKQEERPKEEFIPIINFNRKLLKEKGYRVEEQKIWQRILGKIPES